jgi:F0F1-type ATP synthase delta subunit
VNQLSKEELLKALKQLVEKLDQIKTVDLTIAVEPDEPFKKAVHQWILTNINDMTLPRYTVNPRVVGGATISYGGNLMDFSLRNKIDELPLFKRKV